MITEDDLEQECLNWFRELDWEVLCGYDKQAIPLEEKPCQVTF